MAITVTCPRCQVKIKAPEKALGHRAKCPSCKETILIQAPAPAAAPPAADDWPAAASPIISRPSSRKKPGGALLIHILPAGLLALALSGVVVRDIVSDAPPTVKVAVNDEVPEVKNTPPSFQVAIEDEPEEKTPTALPRFTIQDEPEERSPTAIQAPKVQIQDEPEERTAPAPVKVEIKDEPEEAKNGSAILIDPTPHIAFQCSPLLTFGVSTTAAAGRAANKQLTYAADGSTNTTVVRIDGKTGLFGEAPGRILERNAKLPEAPGQKRHGSQSTWSLGNGAFLVSQILEVVPSKQPVTVDGKPKRVLDTLLVRWVLHNKDKIAHRAGLRIQVDTLIGANDGVPFTVPGLPGLVTSFADFSPANKVPDFIQALEVPNLRDPGTIAHMSLKVGPNIAAPDRVSLTAWLAGFVDWDVPVRQMGQDSAVILYWNERVLKPGEKRELGFAYGLGSVSSNEGTGRLGITLGGSFDPGQEFSVTAYVVNPIPGQTLSLELPDGLERTDGKETQAVPGAKGKETTSIVTWKAKVLRNGDFPIRVKSSTGITQTKIISIASATVGGKLAIELDGSFAPGETFQVHGIVSEPAPGQTLTLNLPTGLERIAGDMQQPVPALPDGMKDGKSKVSWKVKVREVGKFPVRVESSTGVAQRKTITIQPPEKAQGSFTLNLDGNFAPGEVFTVQARVSDPAAGQRLTLQLPAGLDCVAGKLQQPVPMGSDGKSALTWKVKVRQTGKFAVRVQSSTGVTQTKTITIAAPEKLAGAFMVSLRGEFAPGKVFEVIAQVANPVADQTLTLQLPPELQCVTQPEKKKVLPAGPRADSSLLSWNVKVLQAGKHAVRVQSSTGITQKKTIVIERPDEMSGKFTFALEGAIQPGKEFVVQAAVSKPVAGQKLTIVLPKGLELAKSAAEQTVPPGSRDGVSQVAWTVRVAAAPLPPGETSGRFPIRVQSTTGVARTKTITITGSATGPAIFGQ